MKTSTKYFEAGPVRTSGYIIFKLDQLQKVLNKFKGLKNYHFHYQAGKGSENETAQEELGDLIDFVQIRHQYEPATVSDHFHNEGYPIYTEKVKKITGAYWFPI